MRWSGGVAAVLLGVMAAGPGVAQSFTTAAEVKPILAATKGNWVAVREYEGNDLLYFTHLESWRCGLSEIRYAVNGGAMTAWQSEPCHEGTAQPNALTLDGHLPYVVLPLGSVQSVAVVVVFDDGSEDGTEVQRAAVLIP